MHPEAEMNDTPAQSLRHYTDLLGQVKSRVRQARTKAILPANAEMIRLYRDISELVSRAKRQRDGEPPSSPALRMTSAMTFPT